MQAQKLVSKSINNADVRLNGDINKLEALNPLRILKSGYLKGEIDGKGIINLNELNIGDKITIYSQEAKAEATINNIEKLS